MVNTEVPVEDMATADLSIYGSNVLARYNKLRQDFYTKVGHYYRQSVRSEYTKESELIQMLEQLSELKEHYTSICDILTGRGEHTRIDQNSHFPSNDFLFKHIG